MTLSSFLTVRDRQRLEQLARRERTTPTALVRIAVRELLRASDAWDGEDRRRVERRAMDATPAVEIARQAPATVSPPARARHRPGGGPWTPAQRARYQATIAAKRAQREEPPPAPTERPCQAACGQLVALHTGMGRQPEYCPVCKRLRALRSHRISRRVAVLAVVAEKVAASMQPGAPEPEASPDPGARSPEPAPGSLVEPEPDPEPDILDEDGDSDPMDDDEDVLDLPDPPVPARASVARRPLRHPKAATSTTAGTGGSWWMTTQPGEFTKTAASRLGEMSRGKGAKIASQMESARREP